MCSVFRRSSGRFKLHEAIQEGKPLDWRTHSQHWLQAWCMVSVKAMETVGAAWGVVRPLHASKQMGTLQSRTLPLARLLTVSGHRR
jgi:hypothetical protein